MFAFSNSPQISFSGNTCCIVWPAPIAMTSYPALNGSMSFYGKKKLQKIIVLLPLFRHVFLVSFTLKCDGNGFVWICDQPRLLLCIGLTRDTLTVLFATNVHT